MKLELYFLILLVIVSYECYYNYPILKFYKKYKKYGTYCFYLFLLFSLYLVFKRNPNQTYDFLGITKNLVKMSPVDRTSKELFNPLFELHDIYSKTSQSINHIEKHGHTSNIMTPQQQRVISSGNHSSSGSKSSKRSVSETKKKYVASLQNWKCKDCDDMLSAWFEVDHIVPLHNGGTNNVNNLVALCRNCHGKKTAMEHIL